MKQMFRRVTAFAISLVMVLSLFAPVMVLAETENNEAQIKNIIYLIPDGGGYGPYDMADKVKQAGGFSKSRYPYATPVTDDPMYLKSYLAGSVDTNNVNGTTTDSAAGGTALSTGHRTINGYVGIDENKVPVATILEGAQYIGKAVGMVTTKCWTDATPASFASHAVSRNDIVDIYHQIENKGLQVVLGVGYGNVTAATGETIQNAIDRGYSIITNKTEKCNMF